MEILKGIGAGISGVIMFVSSFLGLSSEAPKTPTTQVAPSEQSQNLGAFNPAGGLTYRLQTSAGSTDTSIRLSSFLNRSGLPLTMSLLNTSVGYGTLDPQNPTRSEFISFTGITQNSDGTAILTGVTRGRSDIYPFTASTTQRLAHSGQSIFILSDSPQLFGEYSVKQNAETISGLWTHSGGILTTASSTFTSTLTSTGSTYLPNIASSTFTGPTQALSTITVPYSSASSSAASVGYVNATAVAGAPNASTVQKGIVEEATIPEINSAADTGGTGAKLFMTPQDFSNSNFASSSPAVFATTTSVAIATSTLSTIPSKTYLEVVAYASTTPTVGALRLSFNGDVTNTYNYQSENEDGGAPTQANAQAYIDLNADGSNIPAGHSFTVFIRIFNQSTTVKYGEATLIVSGEQTQGFDQVVHTSFMWKNTSSAISSISLSTVGTPLFGTNLYMRVTGY